MKKIKTLILCGRLLGHRVILPRMFYQAPINRKHKNSTTVVPPGDIKVPSDSAQIASLTDSLFALLVKHVQQVARRRAMATGRRLILFPCEMISIRSSRNSPQTPRQISVSWFSALLDP